MRLSTPGLRLVFILTAMIGLGSIAAGRAVATPALVMDVASGDVLYQDQATQPWYPASLTKLMTTYVALTAVREHRIALDTPLKVSARAASMAPSKMGFAPGTEVTLDNALRMMLVKSANDLAVTIAEGVSGSVEAFADEMNDAAAKLGLQQSHFANPNGLPDSRHVSSARDLAIIARALYLTFPDKAELFGIGALSLNGQIITNHNPLIGRYPGVDGMKTGFTCAAGFNLVASAYRGGRRLVVVILGAPNVAVRTMKAAVLLDRAFAGIDRPSGSVTDLAFHGNRGAPDMHNSVCRQRGKAIAQFKAEIEQLEAPLATQPVQDTAMMPERAFFFNAGALSQQAPMAARLSMVPAPVFEPQTVYLGPAPGYSGPIAEARPPHSPVGTEPTPATASAYAATRPQGMEATAMPLAPDVNALPLHARRGRLAKRPHGRAAAAKPARVASKTAGVVAKKPAAAPQKAAVHAGTRHVTHHVKTAAKVPATKAAGVKPGLKVKPGKAAAAGK